MLNLKQIQDLVANNRIEDALKALEPHVESDDEFTTRLNLIKIAYENYRKQKLRGTLTFREESIMLAGIAGQLLDLINDVKKKITDSGKLIFSETKRILFLAANPSNTSRLNIDKEWREIDGGIRMSSGGGNIQIEYRPAVRVKDLRRAMLDFKPNIVHFSGHGSPMGKLIIESEEAGSASLESEPLGEFLGMFHEDLECVFLNACFSEIQADEIVKKIPYVIGMNNKISDVNTAIPFAVAFYDTLGAGKGYDFAFDLAVKSMKLTGGGSEPVLKQKK